MIAEHGGSFLNTDQHAVRTLASRLGLRQMVVNGGDLPHGDEVFLIDGRIYSYAEAMPTGTVSAITPSGPRPNS